MFGTRSGQGMKWDETRIATGPYYTRIPSLKWNEMSEMDERDEMEFVQGKTEKCRENAFPNSISLTPTGMTESRTRDSNGGRRGLKTLGHGIAFLEWYQWIQVGYVDPHNYVCINYMGNRVP